jgi:hypothetical protein
MKTVKSFITVLNGVITGKHHGDIDAEFFDTPYYNHEKIEVPFEAEATPMEPLTFYEKNWKRKSNVQLIKEKIWPMPIGHVWEGEELRAMTNDERVIAGIDEPMQGFKVENGKIVAMTMKEKVDVGIITQADCDEQRKNENINELQYRLSELQTPEILAQAEIDEKFAVERKEKLCKLLAVKEQPKWPLEVKWPK